MAGVFQNIDPPPPSPPGECVEDTLAGWRGGWGVNILEDARHSSVCKYFVPDPQHWEKHAGLSLFFSWQNHNMIISNTWKQNPERSSNFRANWATSVPNWTTPSTTELRLSQIKNALSQLSSALHRWATNLFKLKMSLSLSELLSLYSTLASLTHSSIFTLRSH